jgi:hypothetical protein
MMEALSLVIDQLGKIYDQLWSKTLHEMQWVWYYNRLAATPRPVFVISRTRAKEPVKYKPAAWVNELETITAAMQSDQLGGDKLVLKKSPEVLIRADMLQDPDTMPLLVLHAIGHQLESVANFNSSKSTDYHSTRFTDFATKVMRYFAKSPESFITPRIEEGVRNCNHTELLSQQLYRDFLDSIEFDKEVFLLYSPQEQKQTKPTSLIRFVCSSKGCNVAVRVSPTNLPKRLYCENYHVASVMMFDDPGLAERKPREFTNLFDRFVRHDIPVSKNMLESFKKLNPNMDTSAAFVIGY